MSRHVRIELPDDVHRQLLHLRVELRLTLAELLTRAAVLLVQKHEGTGTQGARSRSAEDGQRGTPDDA
jgi:hypothetical protein